MAYINISSFFGNVQTNGMNSFNFSDYASIKNGSYKKLVKSYLVQQKGDSADKGSTSVKKPKKDTTDQTGLARMKTQADSLKKSAKELSDDALWKQTNGKYDMDKIAKAVKGFANDYNDTIDQAAKVTSRDVSQQTGFMTSMTKTMSTALSKVGITIGADGKMSVNEDELKKADTKQLKALFSGSASYGAQMEQKASAISSAALRNSSLYSSNGTLSSAISGTFEGWM